MSGQEIFVRCCTDVSAGLGRKPLYHRCVSIVCRSHMPPMNKSDMYLRRLILLVF